MDIHVGNIPFKWKEKDLESLFDEFGEVVSVKIIIDKITRQNKGFGFVTMAHEEAGLKAINALDKTIYDDREISVSKSMPKEKIRKPQRKAPEKTKSTKDFKSLKHKNSVPPWLRKEY